MFTQTNLMMFCEVAEKTKTVSKNIIRIECYGEIEEYPQSKRKELLNHFLEGAIACEGAESERYFNIYTQLLSGENDIKDTIY